MAPIEIGGVVDDHLRRRDFRAARRYIVDLGDDISNTQRAKWRKVINEAEAKLKKEDPFWRFREAPSLSDEDHKPQDWGGGGI